MILILCSLAIAWAQIQLCNQTNDIQSYTYTSNPASASTNQWNYNSLGQSSIESTTDQKTYSVTGTSLLPLQITVDVPATTNLTVKDSIGPFRQYGTSDLRLVSQNLNEIVSYQSIYFTIGQAEHNFDYMNNKPDAELQITFIQESLYGVCNIEPIYGVLAVPIYSFTGQDAQNKAPYTIQMSLAAANTNITEFDIKTNILGQLKSNMVSYVSYQAPINVKPFDSATWWVINSALFIQKGTLESLLSVNQLKTVSRIKSNTPNFVKGTFYYQGDDWVQVGDDTVQWAATWVASIIPCVFFALIVCIYGQYELSNIGRYRRPEPKPVGLETEALHQDEDKQLA